MKDGLAKLIDRQTSLGVTVTLAAQFARRLDAVTERARHAGTQPSISSISRVARVFVSPMEILSYLGIPLTGARMVAITESYNAVQTDITERYRGLQLGAPEEWRVERATGFLLFALISSLKPAVVLETGTANGHSTAVNLRALDLAGGGSLHSVDVSGSVGALLTMTERNACHLHTIRPAHAVRDFKAVVRGLSRLDLFFHDSDHSYTGQLSELRTVWPIMPSGGYVVVDDANESWAFFDFASELGLEPVCLFDSRKITGIVRKP